MGSNLLAMPPSLLEMPLLHLFKESPTRTTKVRKHGLMKDMPENLLNFATSTQQMFSFNPCAPELK